MKTSSRKIEDAMITAFAVIHVLWWPVLELAAVIALLVIAFNGVK